VLRDDVIWVATELEAARDTFATNRDRYQKLLTSLATTRSLPFTSLVSRDGSTLMRAQINVQGAQPSVPVSIMASVKEGVPTLLSPGTTNMVGALVKLRGYSDTYLFAARPVNQAVVEYMKLTDENISEYRLYASNRMVFQLTFALMYLGLALVLLLAALWIGIALANRFVDPIRNLMIASNNVARGRLDVRVPLMDKSGDLHDLGQRFNTMIGQLKSQRQALVDANQTNEKRRLFTEAVVEGVSAGVVGLDQDGAIKLVNLRCCTIFKRDEISLMGEDITTVVPQLAPLIERARSSRRGQIRDQIELGPQNDLRTYQAQLTREGTMTESKGFVVTLDDITDLVSAQRTSAWADVARRIAHEIKNPLTPIQLSAERLRKRYRKKLTDDFEVFDKCTDTIIRQVADIGRMVDEFSSFARMPTAVLERDDLADTIRQAVFLESVRQPQIKISADIPEGPLFAHFDKRLIAQAMTNLIKNGVEALETAGLDKGKTARICVSTRLENEFVRIDVKDNGNGWPRENRHRLLEPYMTTREKGTGLGLAIVAKIIEQHGGTIELRDADWGENKDMGGACVSFTLALLAPEATAEKTGTKAANGAAQGKDSQSPSDNKILVAK